MSGIEIIGLAASVIQIAEVGGKLSVKLFTFTRKVKTANKSIDALSQDIAATGAVLKQLGETLSKDASLKVCSQEAVNTAKTLVEDTKKVFTGLEKVIDNEEKTNNRLLNGISFKKRLKFAFLEPQIEQVQANLERLKSSLLVILNVLIFAEQLRNQEALPILRDQRELIKILATEKDENEKRYEQILKAIAERPVQQSPNSADNPGSLDKEIDLSLTTISTASTVVADNASSSSTNLNAQPVSKNESTLPLVDLPPGLKHHHRRIQHHSDLVQNLLAEIKSLQYDIDHGTRDRMHSGILDIHWNEWTAHRRRHGFEHFEKILEQHADVARYWMDKLYYEHVPSQTIPSPVVEISAWHGRGNCIPVRDQPGVQKHAGHRPESGSSEGDEFSAESQSSLPPMLQPNGLVPGSFSAARRPGSPSAQSSGLTEDMKKEMRESKLILGGVMLSDAQQSPHPTVSRHLLRRGSVADDASTLSSPPSSDAPVFPYLEQEGGCWPQPSTMDKPSLNSASYQALVDKHVFFGQSNSSSILDKISESSGESVGKADASILSSGVSVSSSASARSRPGTCSGDLPSQKDNLNERPLPAKEGLVSSHVPVFPPESTDDNDEQIEDPSHERPLRTIGTENLEDTITASELAAATNSTIQGPTFSSRDSASTTTNDASPKKRNKKTAAAGAAGATAVAIWERHRSKSRGRARSKSPDRLKQGVPLVGAGLATAALAHLYEKRKCRDEADEIVRAHDGHGRPRRGRSWSRSPTRRYRSRSGRKRFCAEDVEDEQQQAMVPATRARAVVTHHVRREEYDTGSENGQSGNVTAKKHYRADHSGSPHSWTPDNDRASAAGIDRTAHATGYKWTAGSGVSQAGLTRDVFTTDGDAKAAASLRAIQAVERQKVVEQERGTSRIDEPSRDKSPNMFVQQAQTEYYSSSNIEEDANDDNDGSRDERQRTLLDEEERRKRKKDEREYQQRVKERFMKAGYWPDHIDDILEQRTRSLSMSSQRDNANKLAIDMSRPTYIRCHTRHLLPETVDYYGLPWQYDQDDPDYLIIMQYIPHDLQQELFEHTRKITTRVERLKTLETTEGYTKDTVTALKPKNVAEAEGSDEMFVARSERPQELDPVDKLVLQFTNIGESELRESTSEKDALLRERRTWMFT